MLADPELTLVAVRTSRERPPPRRRTAASMNEQQRPPRAPLLGWATEPLDGQTRWRCAVAGGTRTVTLDTVEMTGNVRGHGRHAARTASGESHVAGP